MQLGDWLKQNNKTGAEFAEELGVGRSDVSRWINGKVRPSWDILPKIAAATDNKVTANDFVPPSEVADGVNDLRPVAAAADDDDADALGKGAAA